MRSGTNSNIGLRMLATGLVATAVLSACSSSSGGGGNGGGGAITNPAALTTNLNTIVGTINTGAIAGLGSLPTLAGNTLAGLAAGHDGGSMLRTMIATHPGRALQSAQGGFFHAPVRPWATGAVHSQGVRRTQGAVIDAANYTKSYSYDAQTGLYVDDGGNAGPADGVRFTLYADNGSGGIDPNTPNGYLLVHDLSSGTTLELGIQVTSLDGLTTFADYTTTVVSFDPQTLAFQMSSGGTVSDGTNTYNFTYDETFDAVSSDDINVAFGTSGVSLTDKYLITQDQQTGDVTIAPDLTISNGTDNVRLAGTITQTAAAAPADTRHSQAADAFNLTVYTNGGVYATATTVDANQNPIFLTSGGTQIPAEDYNFLVTFVNVTQQVNNIVYTLVLFALIIAG